MKHSPPNLLCVEGQSSKAVAQKSAPIQSSRDSGILVRGVSKFSGSFVKANLHWQGSGIYVLSIYIYTGCHTGAWGSFSYSQGTHDFAEQALSLHR